MYRAIGLPAPKIYRFGSPLSCILSIPYLSGMHGTGYYESAVLKILKGPQLNTLGVRLNGSRNSFDRQGDDRWDRLGDLLRDNMAHPINQQVTDGFIENFKSAISLATDDKCKPGREEVFGDSYVQLAYRVVEQHGWDRVLLVALSEFRRGLGISDRLASDAPRTSTPSKYKLWVWLGVRVTAQVIAFPETVTIKQVRKEKKAKNLNLLLGFLTYSPAFRPGSTSRSP